MDSYMGEIRIFAFSFAPIDWAFCAGQTMGIGQQAALYSLLGTTFGGDGKSTFNLPNLCTLAVACGTAKAPNLTPYTLGETVGVAAVTLTVSQTPQHTHTLQQGFVKSSAAKTQETAAPNANSLIGHPIDTVGNSVSSFAPLVAANLAAMNSAMVTPAWGDSAKGGTADPHSNTQPYLAMNFCMSLNGEYPVFD